AGAVPSAFRSPGGRARLAGGPLAGAPSDGGLAMTTPPGAAVGLVGCSRRKLPHAAPACPLYASPLFPLAARSCALTCERWFVLSAKHGLVAPDEVIEPYDVTLKSMARPEREAWAVRVAEQLRERGLLSSGHRLVLHAGADYAGPLARLIRVEQP